MTDKYSRRLRMGLLATVAALCLVFVTAIGALADTVHVYDRANVLNVSQVQSEAANLSDPMDIYTTNTFTGTKAAFDQRTRNLASANSRLIVMAIDTVHKHLYIDGGSSVPLTRSQYDAAVNAFISSFNGDSNYTNATIAAIHSLRGSLSSGGGFFSGLFSNTLGTLCCIGLIILVVGGLIFAVTRRRRFVGSQAGIPYQAPYQQPYQQGYPPNYYGPPAAGGGINPWVAGGLGAAGGGLIGYELGKAEGEREANQQDQGYGGGDFGGGGGGGDFGSGGGGDSGGGGGGDFGGGDGGDFGSGGGGNF